MNAPNRVEAVSTGGSKLRSHPSLNRGFTIIELVITISIIAILTLVAVPSMRDWFVYNSVKTKCGEIVGLLDLARAKAIEGGRVVNVWGRFTDTSEHGDGTRWDHQVLAEFNETIQSAIADKTPDALVGVVDGDEGKLSIQLMVNGSTDIADIVFLPNGMSGYSADAKSQQIATQLTECDNGFNTCIKVCGRNSSTWYVGVISLALMGERKIDIQTLEQIENPCTTPATGS